MTYYKLRSLLFFVIYFFIFRGVVLAAPEFTVCGGSWNQVCGGSKSWSQSGGECYIDIAGLWKCRDHTWTGSEKCGGFGWKSADCNGCGSSYTYYTCTNNSCENNNGAESGALGYVYCCKADAGNCGGDAESCNNPGRCSDGSAINKNRSGDTWTWNCSGSCGGSSSRQCTAPVTTPVDSVCGNAEDREYQEGTNTPVGAADLCGPENKAYWTTDQNDDCKGWCSNDPSKNYYHWLCKGACNDPVKCSAVNDGWPRGSTTQLYRDPVITPAEDEPDPPPVKADVYNKVNINNICQSAFDGSLRVLWKLTITDSDGIADIKSAQLRFTPITGGSSFYSTVETPNNGVADFIMDTKLMTAATYKVEYQLEDRDSPPGKGPWTDSTRNFKVWDCMVGIGGTIFDSSGETTSPSCEKKYKYSRGYVDLISDQKNFTWSYGLVNRISELDKIDTKVTSPYYSSNGETSRKLKWSDDSAQATYQPISSDFPGQLVTQTRVNDTTCLKTSFNLDLSQLVSPYAADNPSIKADYTATMEQDTWFSVDGGNVFSSGKINNTVPKTCNVDEKCATSVGVDSPSPGIVWSNYILSTLSSHDRTKSNGKEFYNKPYRVPCYNYSYFSNLRIGTTVINSNVTLWSSIKNLTGLILVKGDLNIDENINDGQFRMIVAGGALGIGTSVNQVNAVLIADVIEAKGQSDNQLKIFGSVYGSTSIDFRRSFADGMKNNSDPAVLVQYDPSIISKIPVGLFSSIGQWKME